MARWQRESANLDSDDPRVARTVECIMMFVNGSGVLEGADDVTVVHAISIVHSEVEALLEGEDAYRDALNSVAEGAIHPASVLVLLTDICTKRIEILRDVAIELTPRTCGESVWTWGFPPMTWRERCAWARTAGELCDATRPASSRLLAPSRCSTKAMRTGGSCRAMPVAGFAIGGR